MDEGAAVAEPDALIDAVEEGEALAALDMLIEVVGAGESLAEADGMIEAVREDELLGDGSDGDTGDSEAETLVLGDGLREKVTVADVAGVFDGDTEGKFGVCDGDTDVEAVETASFDVEGVGGAICDCLGRLRILIENLNLGLHRFLNDPCSLATIAIPGPFPVGTNSVTISGGGGRIGLREPLQVTLTRMIINCPLHHR